MQPKKITCPICNGTNHKESKCPRLAGISAEPSKAMSSFSKEDYAVLGLNSGQDSLKKWLKREGNGSSSTAVAVAEGEQGGR